MPVNGANVRRLYESFVRGDATDTGDLNGVSGRQGFVNWARNMIGLSVDRDGRRILKDQTVRPEQMDLAEMAVAMIGPDWYDHLIPNPDIDLREDAAAATTPGMFPNISAYNATVGGLLEAKILEGFQKPEFIADRLCTTIPTRLRSTKFIGYSDLADDAKETLPGQRHARTQFVERYVETPDTKKHTSAIDVTREAVFFDETRGQLLQQAEAIGYKLGLRKEKRVMNTFINVTNTYKYGGATYATYVSGGGNWVNTHSNPLVDWTDVDNSLQLFAGMTSQETGEPVVCNPRDVIVMPYKFLTAGNLFRATEIETLSGSGTELRRGANPVAGFNLLPMSIYFYNRHTAPAGDGLALQTHNAREYWYMGDFKRAFAYMENWSMEVRRASPDSHTSLDHQYFLSVFANEMGEPAVLEPRFVVRSTN